MKTYFAVITLSIRSGSARLTWEGTSSSESYKEAYLSVKEMAQEAWIDRYSRIDSDQFIVDFYSLVEVS